MKYKKRGDYNTLNEYVISKTGKSIKQLNEYKSEYRLDKIPLIAVAIMSGIAAGKKFRVHADYDVDGISSAAQMVILLDYFKARYDIKVPMRFTDGYGVKVKHAEKLDSNSILILVDNGISAIDAIKEAKKRGAYVIVMDHHMGDRDEHGNVICPDADILLDPAAINEGNDFCSYCGSGITYKLVEFMIPDPKILEICSAFAALGTIADVVPLKEDNRKIVQDGLYAINHGNITAGLSALVKCMDMTGHVSAEDIAFYLAPLINAPGRLYDLGGTWSAFTLTSKNPDQADSMALKLKEINQSRKDAVNSLVEQIQLTPMSSVNVIRTPDGSPEGCLGLIAGRLAEETGKTTFVYTKTEQGFYKGSARSDNEDNNKVHLMLAGIKDKLLSFGGHPGAAGFSFSIENEDAFRNYMLSYPVVAHDNTPYYDLTIKPEDLVRTLNEMGRCEPFGKGMEKPVFRMPCNFTTDEYWKSMGANGNHIRFVLPGPDDAKAVGFDMKERYLLDGTPRSIYLYGSPGWNWYKGKAYPQFLIDDYEKM